MTALDTLKTWYDRIWMQGDLDAIDELFTPDTEARGMMDFAVGPEDFKALVPAFLAHVALEEIRYDKVVEMGDWVWATMSAHATARATETPVHVTGQIMVRIQDGRILEAYNQFDFLTLFEQLGYLPPPKPWPCACQAKAWACRGGLDRPPHRVWHQNTHGGVAHPPPRETKVEGAHPSRLT